MRDPVRSMRIKKRVKLGAQQMRRLERLIWIQILLPRPIARARNVPRHWIYRLLFTTVALGSASIEQRVIVAV